MSERPDPYDARFKLHGNPNATPRFIGFRRGAGWDDAAFVVQRDRNGPTIAVRKDMTEFEIPFPFDSYLNAMKNYGLGHQVSGLYAAALTHHLNTES